MTHQRQGEPIMQHFADVPLTARQLAERLATFVAEHPELADRPVVLAGSDDQWGETVGRIDFRVDVRDVSATPWREITLRGVVE